MGLFSRLGGRGRRKGSGGGTGESRDERDLASTHLAGFARSREGVEAFVEPATTVTPTTLLLIAKDGEWTRRAVPDADTAILFARERSIPVYDVNLTGYPQRMRDYNARRKAGGGSPPV